MRLNSNASKGYGKKDFPHVVRIGKRNFKGKVALPLKERSDNMAGSTPPLAPFFILPIISY